ncbi:MAG: tetratricopeptide repeat protein [Cyanobacteria bacterium J06635_15]
MPQPPLSPMQFVSNLLTISESLQRQNVSLNHDPLCQSLLQQMMIRQYETVVSAATQLLVNFPDSYGIWYLRGDALANLGRYGEAIDSFAQTLRYCPKAKEALVFQAVCWIHQERPEAALNCCDRALEIASDYEQGWLFRGVALHRLGRYRDAYASYSHALHDERLTWQQRLRQWFRF